MYSVFKRTFKNRRVSLIIYSISSILFMEMYMAMFPVFSERQEDFDKLLEVYPDEIFNSIGLDKAQFTLSKIESFLAVEHFSLIWPIMLIFLAISYGSAQIAEEIEKGTIEVLVSQPISRLKLFISKYIAGFVNILIFAVVSVLSVIPLAAIHDIDYNADGFYMMVILGILFGTAIFSASMFASSVFSERSKANFAIGGLLILSYIANIASSFLDELENLKYASVFYYFDFQTAINKAEIDVLSILVFAGIIIISTTFGALWFIRRDIAT